MDYNTGLVNQFCNQMALMFKGNRNLSVFYIFEDKRPGTVIERFEYDAKRFWEYRQIFQR